MVWEIEEWLPGLGVEENEGRERERERERESVCVCLEVIDIGTYLVYCMLQIRFVGSVRKRDIIVIHSFQSLDYLGWLFCLSAVYIACKVGIVHLFMFYCYCSARIHT